MPDPSPRPLERVVPLVIGAVAVALLVAGGWLAVRPHGSTLGTATPARLMLAGIVLLVGAILFHRPAEAPGPLARLIARLPPGVRFVVGAWLAYELTVKVLVFLSLLWVPHPDHPAPEVARLWIEPLCRDWDAGWYRSIALDGYSYDSTNANVAFFPLYPLLVRAAAAVLPDPCLASALVAQLALLGALAGVYALGRVRLRDEDGARWAVVLTLAWPFAFFFVAAYSESLFLCTAVWACYFAERRRYVIAGVLGALAAATRLTGLTLLPVLLLLPTWSPAPGEPRALLRELRPRLPLLLVPAGTLAFFLYLWLRFGDFWANLHAARAGWGRGLAKGGHDFFASVSAVFLARERPFLLVYTVQLLLGLALVPLLRRLPRAHGWAYTIFVLGLALPGALSGLEAFGRYMAVAFPLIWIAAPAAQRQPARAALAVALLALFQSLFLFLHAHGYWVT